MKKYKITYDTVGGNGQVIAYENEIGEVKATLEQSGCFNIIVEQIVEQDPCDNCNKPICYGCPHAE